MQFTKDQKAWLWGVISLVVVVFLIAYSIYTQVIEPTL